MKVILRVIGRADGNGTTPHDGRYVLAWNPHSEAGTLELTSTADRSQAQVFNHADALRQWRTVSRIEPQRWDGRPNRPLTAITVEIRPV